MRLNRFLASAGLGSRRSVEELITTGQVRINGRVVTDLATKVSPDDAVALTANGGLPYVLPTSAPKVIVCAAFATVKLWLTFGAAA